jgi:hypothetical protein
MDSKNMEVGDSQTMVDLVQRRTDCWWGYTVAEVSRWKDELRSSWTSVMMVDVEGVVVILVEGW